MVDLPSRKPHCLVEMGACSSRWSERSDVLKLQRGLAEKKLDDSLMGENGHLSLEWVPQFPISW